VELEHGVIVVATGARPATTEEYLYGQDPRVVTQVELEEKLAQDPQFATGHSSVVMIQCVGSRDEERPYCSRVCCSEAIKNALKLKELNPAGDIVVLYRDIRSYGFQEEYYQQARRAGVVFLPYEPEDKPVVRRDGDGLKVQAAAPVPGGRVEIPADLVVLSTGIAPADNQALAQLLRVPLNQDGFFLEAHAKLRPLDFAADGLYLCGLAHSPRTISESITQAKGAAIRAVTLLSKEYLESAAITATVNEELCRGCGLCVEVCPYRARELDERGIAQVVEVLCQGCGTCVSICPSGASQQRAFEARQILAMLDAVPV
jgi:heterodisulfide reductase subunit A-like polyferredoxin